MMKSGLMAEKVGFEPTYDFHRNLISSEGRYDHFDTSPSIFNRFPD